MTTTATQDPQFGPGVWSLYLELADEVNALLADPESESGGRECLMVDEVENLIAKISDAFMLHTGGGVMVGIIPTADRHSVIGLSEEILCIYTDPDSTDPSEIFNADYAERGSVAWEVFPAMGDLRIGF